MVEIEIPNSSRVNERIKVRITGLEAKQRVVITAASDDYYCINENAVYSYSNRWSSYAVFIADEAGIVDLSEQNPLEGTYSRADSMGLFYSMKVEDRKEVRIPESLQAIPENKEYHIEFRVMTGNKVLCAKIVKRYFYDETIECTTIDRPGLSARYYTSNVAKQRPAIIVVSGSDGRIEKAQALAQLLAMRGYSSIAVAYFGLKGLPNELSQIPLENIQNAIIWLKEQSTVDKDKIAVYGRSKGGEYALLAASKFNDITATVAVAPSIYVFEGMQSSGKPSHKSSWTYQNHEIPYLSFSFKAMLKYLIRSIRHVDGRLALMYKESLDNKEQKEHAEIPLERCNGKILLISSENDKIWPSGYFTYIAKEKYHSKITRYDYPAAGHMITIPFQSIQDEKKLCDDIKTWNDINVQAWDEVLEFLDDWSNNN